MTKTRGRPRDPSRDRAILAAARSVLACSGYTGSSMEQIAKLAHVGKDTLYRRWPNKEQLALDLIDSMARDAVQPAPIDPDPRLNLLLFLKDVVRLYRNTDFGLLVAGMVGEAARNEDFAQRFADFWARRRAIAAPLVHDVLMPTATAYDIETILDGLFGPIYYRLLLTGTDVTDEYLWDLVMAVPWTADANQNAWSEGDTSPNNNGEVIPAVST
ncbi:MAG: TetR/AcrR family transcriptional regulator [Acidimicrobiales bacterium]|nr:TetR/AcrR family transcriptional regulator [Acidimicrobiales bacterium]